MKHKTPVSTIATIHPAFEKALGIVKAPTPIIRLKTYMKATWFEKGENKTIYQLVYKKHNILFCSCGEVFSPFILNFCNFCLYNLTGYDKLNWKKSIKLKTKHIFKIVCHFLSKLERTWHAMNFFEPLVKCVDHLRATRNIHGQPRENHISEVRSTTLWSRLFCSTSRDY